MFPSYPFSNPSDSVYLRALAEERAAREQYAAARLAEEEARARAARAQARRAYASPYSSYLAGDYLLSPYNGFCVDDNSFEDTPAYGVEPSARSLGYEDPRLSGYGFNPYAQRASMEERRRRELLELEREKERRLLEEERIRKILREEKEREEAARQRLLEEERMRRAFEEERLRQALREEEEAKERERAQMRTQQASVEPIDILRALGLAPPAAVSGKERFGRQPTTRTSPSGIHRTTPSPIRPFPFGQTSQHAEFRKTPSPQPTASTAIPISSESTPTPPTPEQLAAAKHILATYRAYISRKAALATISLVRKRFLAAGSGFALPTTLDYDVASHGRAPPTTVILDPNVHLEDAEDALEGAPRLAYSQTNAPLHAYEEELNRILGALDAVESNGDLGVRAARRELARVVEREAEKVDRWRGVVWRWWVESQKVASASAPVVAPVATETETQAPAPTTETEDELVSGEPLSSASPEETTETRAPTEVPAMEVPMEVEETPTSDSHTAPPAPTSSTNPDDAAVPPVTITVASPTHPEPVEVVKSTPAAGVSTETAHDSETPLRPEATSVDTVSSESTLDAPLHDSPRPVTPALSQGPSEPEEIEVEPLEIHMPAFPASAPVVAVDSELVSQSLHFEDKELALGVANTPHEEAARDI